VGSGNLYATIVRASISSTDGNLHIDPAFYKSIYLNFFNPAGNGANYGATYSYGTFYNSGSVIQNTSDERLKTKVGKIENALDKVCSLTAFKYLNNEIAKQYGFNDDDVQVGLSAQEVQKVLPEVVKPAPFDRGTVYDVGNGNSKSGENYMTIQYERLVSLLVEALKEERKAREALEERIKLLEQK
jgi:hypothetical protein